MGAGLFEKPVFQPKQSTIPYLNLIPYFRPCVAISATLRRLISYQLRDFSVHLQFLTGEQPEKKCFPTVLTGIN